MMNVRQSKVTSLLAICALTIAGFTAPPASATSLVTSSTSFGISSELNTKSTKAAIKKKKLKKKYKTIKNIDPLGVETIFTVMTSQSGPTWGLDRVDGSLDGKFTYASAGQDVLIYIVDTGVNSKHPDLSGRVLDGFDSFGENLDQVDCHGHGTHVAGISSGTYFGVAKLSKVVPVRVLDCNGRGNTTTLTKGIDWILENKTNSLSIVNMSLGGPMDPEVNSSVERLVAAGFIVIAAAGNSGSDACNFSPASAVGVLAVGATDRDDSLASFSNWGSCVDVLAPGVQINSANSKDYGLSSNRSGTSQAAPFVAGAVATYISNKSVTDLESISDKLKTLAKNNIVSVEPLQSSTPVVEPTPPPDQIAQPEPENDPIQFSVSVFQSAPGSSRATLVWTGLPEVSEYQIYKTGTLRPGWRLYATTSGASSRKSIIDKPGEIAIYMIVAITRDGPVEIGSIEYSPRQ